MCILLPYKSCFLANKINQFALHCCKLEFPPCLNKSSFLLNILTFLIQPTNPLSDLFVKFPGTPLLPPEIGCMIKVISYLFWYTLSNVCRCYISNLSTNVLNIPIHIVPSLFSTLPPLGDLALIGLFLSIWSIPILRFRSILILCQFPSSTRTLIKKKTFHQ